MVEKVIGDYVRVAEVDEPAVKEGSRPDWDPDDLKDWFEGWRAEAQGTLRTFVTVTRRVVELEAMDLDDRLLTPEEFAASNRANKKKYLSWCNALANVMYGEQHSVQLLIERCF